MCKHNQDCMKSEKGNFYYKYNCIVQLPYLIREKYIGKSKYYKEFFEDNSCSQIKSKREPVGIIDKNYVDGQCLKYGTENIYV